jgi:hypothetical protein
MGKQKKGIYDQLTEILNELETIAEETDSLRSFPITSQKHTPIALVFRETLLRLDKLMEEMGNREISEWTRSLIGGIDYGVDDAPAAYQSKWRQGLFENELDWLRQNILKYQFNKSAVQKSTAGKSDRGAKKPTGIKEAICQHLKNGSFKPEELWGHFKDDHNKDHKFKTGAYLVYWVTATDTYEIEMRNGEQINPGMLIQESDTSDRIKPISYGTFKKLFYEVKQSLR